MTKKLQKASGGARLLPPPKPGSVRSMPAPKAPAAKDPYRMAIIDGRGLYEHVPERAPSPTGAPAASQIRAALASSPELASVVVVQSFHDLPPIVQANAMRDGVSGQDVCGLLHAGRAYVVADNHDSVGDAIYTAVHEEVGHRGIRGVLGNRLDREMERLYASQALTEKGQLRITQIREHYAPVLAGLDERSQKLLVAEEMVAHLIEDGERPTALQRLTAKARRLLRKLFPQVAWTYADILVLGEQSRGWLKAAPACSQGEDHGRTSSVAKNQA